MQTTAKFFQNAKRPHLPDANAIIAQTCLTCLSFTFLKLEDRAPLGIFLNDPQYVFDYYAAAYWGYHLCAETEIALESQLLDFLNDEECLRQPKGTFLASMNAHQDQHFRYLLQEHFSILQPLSGERTLTFCHALFLVVANARGFANSKCVVGRLEPHST